MSSTRKSALKKGSPKTRKNKNVSISDVVQYHSPKRADVLGFKEKSTDPENMINISKTKSNVILPVSVVKDAVEAVSQPKTFRGRFMSLFTRKNRGGARRRKTDGGMFWRTRKNRVGLQKRSKTPKSPQNSLDRPAELHIKNKRQNNKGFADATSGQDFVDGEWKINSK